jgi:hypothetical protein
MELDGSVVAEQILPQVTELANAMKLKIDLAMVIPSAGEAPSFSKLYPLQEKLQWWR